MGDITDSTGVEPQPSDCSNTAASPTIKMFCEVKLLRRSIEKYEIPEEKKAIYFTTLIKILQMKPKHTETLQMCTVSTTDAFKAHKYVKLQEVGIYNKDGCKQLRWLCAGNNVS